MTIESDPGDARVLAVLVERDELDSEKLLDAALAGVPRGDPVQRMTLKAQLTRLTDLAKKVAGFTWEDIRTEHSATLPNETTPVDMGELPRKLIGTWKIRGSDSGPVGVGIKQREKEK